MKHLLTVILSILALVATVTGCGGAHRYDARLVRADSLMRLDPDSALAIVEGVSRDSLVRDGDRAYRDLLLTQARYRCYVTATSDSDINRALNYYRAHSGEREKLTRALIYKGAVMEELGHPDSAMLYYKQAEATAADDYHNLGYTKYRISTLYQDQLTIDSSAIIYLKEAISCFELENDTNYLISCYGNLGAVCGVKYPDSTEQYLTHAIELAQKYKPEKQYTYKSKLAGFYFYRYQDYRQAKDIAMDVYHNGRQFSYETQFYYYAAMSYIRLGMLDSAKFILKETPAPVCTVDSMNRFEVVAEIAKTENNLKDYSANISHSNGAQMRFVLSRQEDKLKKAESDYDKIQTQDHVERANRKRLLTAISIIVVILTMLLTWLTMRFKRAIKRKNEERNAIEHDLNQIITELEQKQLDQEQNQKTISKLVNYRLDALNELFGSIKFESKGEKKDNIRSIVSLSGVVRGLSDIYRVQKIDLSDDFWEKMKMSVDGEYNGIVSYVEKEYPSLTLRELRLFTLICAKVSPQIIKMCLNYSNVNSVTNKRTIIIKQKMGLDLSLETFIEKYMKNEL
ncbi:MAG: hypothetical protein IJG42_14140 [Muribaculaceae bacterium]|nr:hypothetical protein [Muribaculaceae bacterium]